MDFTFREGICAIRYSYDRDDVLIPAILVSYVDSTSIRSPSCSDELSTLGPM